MEQYNPKYIKNLLKFSIKYDLISTNRFKQKNSLSNGQFIS